MRGFARHTVAAALAWLDAQLQPLAAETCRCASPPAACWRLRSRARGRAGLRSRDDGRLRGGGREHRGRDGAYNRAAADGRRRLDAGPAVRRAPSPRRGGAHHDGRADAARAPTPCCRPSGSRRERRARPTDQSRSRRSRRARTSAARGEDIVAGTTSSSAGRVLRPQDLGVLSSIGMGEVARRAPAARAARRSPATSCCRRDRGRTASTSPTPTGRCWRRWSSATAAWSTFPVWCRDERRGDSRRAARRRRHRHRVGRLERRHRGPGADARRRARRAGRSTASRCGRAARPASAASVSGWCSCCPAIPCRACAPTISSPAARFAHSADAPSAWPYRSIRAPLTRKISSPIGRLDYARVQLVEWRGRTARRRRRVGAVVDDARRRLRDRRRRQRRLRRGQPTSRSGSMREQEQFLQVLDRDEAERGSAPRSTSTPRGSRARFRSTRRSAACSPPTSVARSTCRRSIARTWTASRWWPRTRSARPRKCRACVRLGDEDDSHRRRPGDRGAVAARRVAIATGGMMPRGADAVVMVEHADVRDGDELRIARAVTRRQRRLVRRHRHHGRRDRAAARASC